MRRKFKIPTLLLPALALAVVLLFWEFATRWLHIRDYILPRPSQIFSSLISMGSEWRYNYFVTLEEAALGLLIGSALGFCMGVALAQSKFFRAVSLPFIVASNAIPIVAVAPIIVIWFGNTLMAKIAVAGFISFFPLVLNTFKGLNEYRSHYSQLFSVYGASPREFLLKYKIGNAVAYITTGLKLNATLSVIGAIVGELVSSDRGLGFGILQANYNFNTAKLWAYILLTCSIGIGFYLCIVVIEDLFLKKYKQD